MSLIVQTTSAQIERVVKLLETTGDSEAFEGAIEILKAIAQQDPAAPAPRMTRLELGELAEEIAYAIETDSEVQPGLEAAIGDLEAVQHLRAAAIALGRPKPASKSERGFIDFELIIFALGFMLVGTLIFGCWHDYRRKADCTTAIAARGYAGADVAVFLKSLDLDACDFEASEGLRRQFDRFKAGQESVGRRRAGDEERAHANGMATGIAVGIATQGSR